MAIRILTALDDVFAWSAVQVTAGRDGNDTISGLGGSDTINAGNGSNTVYAGTGNDIVSLGEPTSITLAGAQRYYGGGGEDTLYGGEMGDLLSGDDGNDMLTGEGGNDTVYGGSGNDMFRAVSFGSQMPLAGLDVMYGGEGDDMFDIYPVQLAGMYSARIYGGVGDDSILAGDGAHMIYGGEGFDDVTVVMSSADVEAALFDGGLGKDRLSLDIGGFLGPVDTVSMTSVGAGFEVAVNGVARAAITGFENLSLSVGGDATLIGGTGNDVFTVRGGDATIAAGRGFDRVQVVLTDAAAVHDLDGGLGSDRLTLLGAGDEITAIRLDMRGAEGVLQVGDGPLSRVVGFELFTVGGSGGADTVFAGEQNDTIIEAPAGTFSGDDEFHGGGGDDFIFGGDGADRLSGDAGNDVLIGGQGVDLILGGTGSDRIQGGVEGDRMYGQGGADVFDYATAFDSGTTVGRIDNIFGFTAASVNAAEGDKIDLQLLGDLTFIGTAAFTAAGQVRVQQTEGGTYVVVNLEGINGAEMKIALPDVTAADLGAQDFIL